MSARIAILGFGFSGLMLVANLVRGVARGTTLYIVTDSIRPLGLAYSTGDTDHLLNVPAGKMGAYSDAVGGFYAWLSSYEAAQATQQLGLTQEYRETDFVPRALYGAYLEDLWNQAQQQAGERGIIIKLVESQATAIRRDAEAFAVLTERGDAIAVDEIVLATGHEVKPILPHISPGVIQNPWAKEAFAGAAQWASPVMLMGVGLTAVDVVMRLRNLGYRGEIIAFSRHGLLPRAHRYGLANYSWNKEELFAQQNLQQLVRYVRASIAQHSARGGDWREAIDALRPYTQALWQKLGARDQQRFLKRLLSFWSVHRHRMAPEIAMRIETEIASGQLRLVASKKFHLATEEKKLTLSLTSASGEEMLHPSRVINCTGPEMHLARSKRNLLRQALADRFLEPHANGIGMAVDPHYRAWGEAHPHLYAIGPMMTGQWLESTAVPELREQAAAIAAALIHAQS